MTFMAQMSLFIPNQTLNLHYPGLPFIGANELVKQRSRQDDWAWSFCLLKLTCFDFLAVLDCHTAPNPKGVNCQTVYGSSKPWLKIQGFTTELSPFCQREDNFECLMQVNN